MNLKDAILSTISEIQNHDESPTTQNLSEKKKGEEPPFKINQAVLEASSAPTLGDESQSSEIMEDRFLHDLRERILVLFEGFQSPNNAKIEAKVDLTLNFLEHLLAKIDAKLEKKH